ncbi:hypothetical protein AB0B94_31105 [Micromonospora sp. NPDC048986]|uniref:hypothetical protein n=1 Tax=Micromonospora sp. NPDC048986 TaxID=3155644 RepID=UPI0033DBF506
MIPQSYPLWVAKIEDSEPQVGYVIGWHLPAPLGDVDRDAATVAEPVVVLVDEKTRQQYWTGFLGSENPFYGDTMDQALEAAAQYINRQHRRNDGQVSVTGS